LLDVGKGTNFSLQTSVYSQKIRTFAPDFNIRVLAQPRKKQEL
jgi:hypothetical protein